MSSTHTRRQAPRLHRAARARPNIMRGGAFPDVVPIEQDYLAAAGFDRPDAIARAREVLEQRGLTRAGKRAIATSKIPAVEAALSETLVRVFLGRLPPPRPRWSGRRPRGGAHLTGCLRGLRRINNRRAAIECVRALQRKGVTRVVVVGGTATQQQALEDLLGADVQLRFVDGTNASHSSREALANTRWAQLIIIWASTPLKHAVSDHYTRERAPHARVLIVNRRGIEALCAETVKSYR